MNFIFPAVVVLLVAVASVQSDETTEPSSSTPESSTPSVSTVSGPETTTEDIELSDDPDKMRDAYCESRKWIFSSGKKRELKWVVYNACQCMRVRR